MAPYRLLGAGHASRTYGTEACAVLRRGECRCVRFECATGSQPKSGRLWVGGEIGGAEVGMERKSLANDSRL